MDIRRTSGHCLTPLLRAAFSNDAIELVEIGVEVKDLSASKEFYLRHKG